VRGNDKSGETTEITEDTELKFTSVNSVYSVVDHRVELGGDGVGRFLDSRVRGNDEWWLRL
jgi:hypothetical protein